ncbi:NADP-dependent oxidoreductase [Actinoallomurus sp. NBC_01490]|uniref:quinone oxidoreductase family protein n=1 Tax=Actinoallomurus sp. NBC_01490 TaxID=2903557 RepID=UPI002E3011B7|nr:NADP-dependent oxidoreductase [Actinoallomurus sp. NBC_01490]
MRAIGVRKAGGPEALEVLELPEPQAGPGQVRIRVHAAAVNPTDTLLRAGMGRGDGPWVPGWDAAGVLDQLGPDADGRLSVGQRVVAFVVPHGTHGAYAQQIVVPAASVVPAPENADFATASTVLLNAMTARLALDELALSPGDTLAVTGAAGAFGGYAIQLAKAEELRVVADAKESDVEVVRSLGADDIVERGGDVAARIRAVHPEGVCGIADGAVLNERVLPAVADGGGLATVRFWNGPAERGITVYPVRAGERATDTKGLDRLARQAEQGVLTPRVAAVLPFTEASEAHRRLEAGGVRGRIVLDFV